MQINIAIISVVGFHQHVHNPNSETFITLLSEINDKKKRAADLNKKIKDQEDPPKRSTRVKHSTAEDVDHRRNHDHIH